ncbi:TIGR02679 family protein [Leekyejoonella antrihumi]|uniref:TIGR02679 family protein n=1 Tax=Leekyejoonella antrihumi TaxID=1660198 RepID=A0A563E8H7_9MICO|nr:TIGR02679 family protein [Leekyejoonella antrihumi]TWP38553.1 TIGR02679 family protein [Leekyejoonella antrihumi]
MTQDTPLPAWVSDPRLERLWATVRSRYEAGGLEAAGHTVVALESREERHAAGALLGRAITRDRARIDLAVLDQRLRERSGVGGLAAVLPLVTGGVLQDRPARRAAAQASRQEPLALAGELVTAPWADDWIAGLRSTGLLTGRAGASAIIRQAAAVLTELTRGEVERPRSRVELAAQVTGDAHALDEDHVLHRVVLRGLAAAAGQPAPDTSGAARALWDAYAVQPDLISRTCLLLGLRPGGPDPVSRRLRLAADAGDPVHLTDRDLRALPAFESGASRPALVCENPRVLEAVSETAGGAVPVICTAGEPNTVVTGLLGLLAAAGWTLRYHGDFDWPGIAIANRVVDRFGARPWRMDADDYEAGVHSDAPTLRGREVAPAWDPELGSAMRRVGRCLHEESLLPILLLALADLA